MPQTMFSVYMYANPRKRRKASRGFGYTEIRAVLMKRDVLTAQSSGQSSQPPRGQGHSCNILFAYYTKVYIKITQK